jgi:hypothetical protein
MQGFINVLLGQHRRVGVDSPLQLICPYTLRAILSECILAGPECLLLSSKSSSIVQIQRDKTFEIQQIPNWTNIGSRNVKVIAWINDWIISHERIEQTDLLTLKFTNIRDILKTHHFDCDGYFVEDMLHTENNICYLMYNFEMQCICRIEFFKYNPKTGSFDHQSFTQSKTSMVPGAWLTSTIKNINQDNTITLSVIVSLRKPDAQQIGVPVDMFLPNENQKCIELYITVDLKAPKIISIAAIPVFNKSFISTNISGFVNYSLCAKSTIDTNIYGSDCVTKTPLVGVPFWIFSIGNSVCGSRTIEGEYFVFILSANGNTHKIYKMPGWKYLTEINIDTQYMALPYEATTIIGHFVF